MAQFSNRRRWGLITNPTQNHDSVIPFIGADHSWKWALERGWPPVVNRKVISLLVSPREFFDWSHEKYGRTDFRVYFHLHKISDSLKIWFQTENIINIELAKAGRPARWLALVLIFRYWTLSGLFVREIQEYIWLNAGNSWQVPLIFQYPIHFELACRPSSIACHCLHRDCKGRANRDNILPSMTCSIANGQFGDAE